MPDRPIDTLPRLREANARLPYDRSSIGTGIVHLGVGAFHRAHQAAFVDDCLRIGATGWGIVGASLRSPSVRDALEPQDFLYTLAERDGRGTRCRTIGSIRDILVAPAAPEALVDALCDPAVRIVTLTITEKGYGTNLATGALLPDHPGIRSDLEERRRPQTALGFLAEAIARRREAGTPAFTVLSCDNLPRNGRTLKASLVQFAGLRDAELASFIESEVSCPSSMIDRIVPATTDEDRSLVAAETGLADAWPVVTEPFRQWVVEDDFPMGRPPLDEAGVELVGDVQPFEHMKLRMLNGAHSTIAAIGLLADLATVADTVANPHVRLFLEKYWGQVQVTLSLRKSAADAYAEKLMARFSNSALPHRTAQIAKDASQKIPQRIVAGLIELRRRGAPSDALVLALSIWIRSCGRRSDNGNTYDIDDPGFTALQDMPDQQASSPETVVRRYLEVSPVFGDELPRDRRFVDDLVLAYSAVSTEGTLNVLRRETSD